MSFLVLPPFRSFSDTSSTSSSWAHAQDHPATLYAARLKPEHAGLAITNQIYNARINVRKRAILRYVSDTGV